MPQVDGNNVKEIANNPKPLQVEKGHMAESDYKRPPSLCEDDD